MDLPKLLLNPDAAPFIPQFETSVGTLREENIVDIISSGSTNHETSKGHEIFDPALEPCTHSMEKLKASDEDYRRRIIDHTFESKDHPPQHKTMRIEKWEPKDHLPPYETVGIEKQNMEDSAQHEIVLLSSLFPNFSLQSIREVYHLCWNDMVDSAIALEDLE